MKILLPGFRVVFSPRLSNEEWQAADEIGVRKLPSYNVFRSVDRLATWVEYPFPFVLFDKVLVDSVALEKEVTKLEEWEDQDRGCGLVAGMLAFGLIPTSEYGKCLRLLSEESGRDSVFETYSAQTVLDNNEEDFMRMLISTCLNKDYQVLAKGKVQAMMLSGYNYNAVTAVDPWLFESFNTAITLTAQAHVGKNESIPVYDDDLQRPFYEAFVFHREIEWKTGPLLLSQHVSTLLEVIPEVLKDLGRGPLTASPKLRNAEVLKNRILELRNDVSSVKEFRLEIAKLASTLDSLRSVGVEPEELLKQEVLSARKKREAAELGLLTAGAKVAGAAGVLYLDLVSRSFFDPSLWLLKFLLIASPLAYDLTSTVPTYWSTLNQAKWVGLFEKFPTT